MKQQPEAADALMPPLLAAAINQGRGAGCAEGNGRLWLGRNEAAAPGLTVLDVSGTLETVVEDLIDTVLTSINIDFLIAP